MRPTPVRVPALATAAALGLLLLASPARADAPVPQGAALYRSQCARCHGKAGEGSKRYASPLVGDRSVPQLAKLVQETMPEADPGSLSDDEARAIAEWMHAEFYSPAARDAAKPPRVELARLTVEQYRNTVGDLLASFSWEPDLAKAKPGLRGQYFAGRGWDDKKRKLTRTDPQVSFDFGDKAPVEGLDAGEFYLHWDGTVVPPETGEYEFTVRATHGVALWVNDTRTPIIDARVQSGADTDHKGSISLSANRPYAVKLEFSKAKRGVQNKVVKGKPEPAFVHLEWKRPGQTVRVPIESRFLTDSPAPERYAEVTPFPPDDKSLGWVRGTTISKAFDQAQTDSALAASAHVAKHLNRFADTKDDAKDRAEKVRKFARSFVDRAFRRPVADSEVEFWVGRHYKPGVELELATRKVVILALKSPRFLYREVGGDPADGYSVASRLSYALWDSMPDKWLFDDAKAGHLKSRAGVETVAKRLAAHPRATAKLAGFLDHWLNLDRQVDLTKAKGKFDGFDARAALDLRTSLDLSLREVLDSPGADFRKLLLGNGVYLNPRLAGLYGAELDGDADGHGGFQKVELDPDARSGVLTHPYLLAANAYTAESSPIHRGVFLARGILGLNLKPPSEAFTPLEADLHPKLSTRERVLMQTAGTNCQTCHGVINPLGFALENFDAIGRFRATDRDKPVDAKGKYLAKSGEVAEFVGGAELAEYLATSGEVHDSFAEQLFHHLVQQPVRAYGANRQSELRDKFTASGYNIRDLAVTIAVESATPPKPTPAKTARADSRPTGPLPQGQP